MIGQPDEDQLIKPKAYVVPKPGVTGDAALAEALQQHVKAQLAPYKYPRWVEFAGELPKTATGKIQRFKLRAKSQTDCDRAAATSRPRRIRHEQMNQADRPARRSRAAHRRRGAASPACRGFAFAQGAKLKVGLMLPYTGTFAALGVAIDNGFKLSVAEQGGKLGGREIEYFKVDDESDPSKATDNVNKLIKRDKVDVLVGTVHSGVAMAHGQGRARERHAADHPQRRRRRGHRRRCARPTSSAPRSPTGSPAIAMGKVLAERGIKKVVTITWKYAAGDESINGFKEGFEKAGGKVVKELTLPFPNVEFQALLTEIAAIKPDAVFAFFAGGGAVKFVKDYAGGGPEGKIPLYGAGFLTDGTLEAQGDAAEGLRDHAALRRRPETPQEQGLPPRLRQGLQAAARRLRGAGLRRRAAAGRRPERGEGRHRARRTSLSPRWRRPRSTARAARSPCPRRTTRCRTSTCARSRARRTR